MNVSKKILALLLAMLMAFSALAVSASADGEPATPPEGTEGEATTVLDLTNKLPALQLKLDAENKVITTNYQADSTVENEGETYELEVAINPDADVFVSFDKDGNYLFSQLEYGKTYTVTVSVVDPDTEDKTEIKGSVSASVTLKNKQSAPTAVVPFEITSKSIKITVVKDYLYMLADAEGNVIYDWEAAKASGAFEYDKLEENTTYVISVKIPENATHYESDAVSISAMTKLSGKTGTPEFGLADKTENSITLTKLDGVEYSLDKSKWQKSNVFTGLTKDTQYTIYARFAFDAAKEDPSAISEALVVKTNAKANYEANKKKIAFSAENGQYANGNITFSVTGDGPANMSEAIYGDTRIVPVAYTVVFGSETIKETTAMSGSKLSESGSFTAPDYAEKVVTVKVTFINEEYKGNSWVAVSEFTESYEITIGRPGDTGTKILEFFEGILNFLLNTVPAFFTEALKSDVWGRLFEVIGNIGK